jgi:hypothetical protein
MKNQGNALENAKREYQIEQENNLFAMLEEREIKAFDAAFNHDKPSLPSYFKVKKTAKKVKSTVDKMAVGLGRRGGNNIEFIAFMEKTCGAAMADILTFFDPAKGNTDKAGTAVDSMVTWLKARSSLGTDTWYQNKYFADYIENVLSGKNKYEEKAKMYKALSSYGAAYQNFRRDGIIRPAWIKQAQAFISFLDCLNLL